MRSDENLRQNTKGNSQAHSWQNDGQSIQMGGVNKLHKMIDMPNRD